MSIQMNGPHDIGIHDRFYANLCILIGVWHLTKANIHKSTWTCTLHMKIRVLISCVKIALKY